MRRFRSLSISFTALLLSVSTTLVAQDTTRARPDTAKPPADTQPTPPAAAPAPSLPFDFSGILYANYQYGGVKGNRSTNRFELERAYLTFRATPGEHFAVRITADIYQQRDTTRDQYYRGWTFRAKYAYGQYDFIRGIGDELKASVRLGMLQTVVIEFEEQHWQRGLSQVALEQQGFFSSSDLGGALNVVFPKKRGELYATIVNGSGYASRETDRFKDYGVRLTLTPLANSYGFWKGLSDLALVSERRSRQRFCPPTRHRGSCHGRATEGSRRHLLGLRDPRIVLGAQIAQRWDAFESADTTVDTAPTSVERAGQLVSLHATVRPLAYINSAPAWPLAVVLRADHFKPDSDRDPYTRNYIAGLQWEFNRRTSLTFDYQNVAPREGGVGTDNKVYFLHFIAGF